MEDRRVIEHAEHPAGARSWRTLRRGPKDLRTAGPSEDRRWEIRTLHDTFGGDALFAGAAAVVVLVLGLIEHDSTNPLVVTTASVVAVVPLLLRRRFPLTTAFVSAAFVTAISATLLNWPGRLVAMAAFGSAAYHRPRPVVLVGSVGWFLVLAVAGVRPPGATAYTDLILLGVAPVAVGYALRLHRDRADQAARLYQEETRRAVAEEHARVAREVHDAVGHHLTVIRMQANAVRHVARPLPPIADQALSTIAASSATALAEVREVLATLRVRGSTLTDLDTLVDHSISPDRTVTLTQDSPARLPLPPLVDHAGYRLAQEALTNVLRHSDATRVDVRVHHMPDAVVITVADNGSTTPGAPAEGSGLRGMRERVRLLGGTLRIGPNQPSGWLIEAHLPFREGR